MRCVERLSRTKTASFSAYWKEDERVFMEELRNRRITPELPAYKVAINAWREKHRVR
jgi:hypothetical protein